MSAEAPKTRHCNKCDSTKELDAFPRKKSIKRDGRASYCLECCKIIGAQQYQAKKEQIAKYNLEYYKKNSDRIKMTVRKYVSRPEIKARLSEQGLKQRIYKPEIHMLRGARHRATKLSLPFSITIEDIIVPKYCPVLGIELKHGTRSSRDNSPSLDRIVPALGYVPGNIIVMSKRANTLKSNGTLEEHQKLVEWMKSL